MTKNLVVVESPAKAKTIERYLGPDYRVLASYGHVRDLPENPGKGKLGVDVEHDFEPDYVVPDDRRRQVDTIEREAKKALAVYLATDLDREGEAIAWHVAEAAHVPAQKQYRVTFNEITESAIRDAFAHPRQIDANLVDAQQTRRIVDRLVGYTLSPLVSKKVRSGLSAGRVQSVAVRLVVEREREIRAFTAEEYWTIAVGLLGPEGSAFDGELSRINGKKPEIRDAETAQRHVDALLHREALITDVSTKKTSRNPAPPFTTSTLQQEASRKLGFSPKRTMAVAQRLYEGIDLGEEHVGLITYMRTDSVALAKSAMSEAQVVIAERFGPAYQVAKGRFFKAGKSAQEAHEAIRPTSFARNPEELARHLDRDDLKLYRLIWQRAIASQMAAKELETTTIELEAGEYGLRASATRTLFDGFSRVYTEGRDDVAADEAEGRLPELKQGDRAQVESVTPTQHFTEPPPRYTEASLVKALEEKGIGRPSTYAATISTIVDRGYVVVKERRLHPELVGEIVTDLLVEHFGEFVDPEFTAKMEERLDEVAQGKLPWVPLLREFYGPLKQRVDEKRVELKRRDFTTQPSDEVCSQGHPMVIRLGRNGRFLACSLYPEHTETRPLPGEELPELPGVGEVCPVCGESDGGVLVAKRGRFGAFVGCSRYPDCTYIKKDGPPPPPPLPFEAPCPTCKEGKLVPRRARRTGSIFWGCSRYPKCRTTTSHEPLGPRHDVDDAPVASWGENEARCLACGALVEIPAGTAPETKLPGGPAEPAKLASTGGRRGGRSRAAAEPADGAAEPKERKTTRRTTKSAASKAKSTKTATKSTKTTAKTTAKVSTRSKAAKASSDGDGAEGTDVAATKVVVKAKAATKAATKTAAAARIGS